MYPYHDHTDTAGTQVPDTPGHLEILRFTFLLFLSLQKSFILQIFLAGSLYPSHSTPRSLHFLSVCSLRILAEPKPKQAVFFRTGLT